MKKLAIPLLLLATAVGAQQAAEIWGGVYLSSPRTLSDKQTSAWRVGSTGKLVTDIVAGGCGGVIDLSAGCMFPLAH